MPKSKTIKFKKRNPARAHAAKKPFDFNAYNDADSLVDAYVEYKYGRTLKDILCNLFSPDAHEIADLITTVEDRTEHEELELLRTNKKYREWSRDAELFETAAHVTAILRDNNYDDDAPQEWQPLTVDTLEYVHFNFTVQNPSKMKERAKTDFSYDFFMYQSSKYNPHELDNESNRTFWYAVFDLANFFGFAPK